MTIRNVRNFWLELDIDDKQAPLASGPVAKRRIQAHHTNAPPRTACTDACATW